MSFKAIGTLSPFGGPVLRTQILANSITVTEGASVKAASGFMALGTSTALVFGHVASLVTFKGVGNLTTGVAGSAIGSFVGTFLTASDNQTVAKVSATCDVSKETLYSASESQAIGTTTGSNLLGYTQLLTDAYTLTETSALTTTQQYMGWGVDPNDSTKAVVNIYQSQIFGV